MNVTPAHGRLQATPRIDCAQNPREQRDERESFEEVLAAALRLPGVARSTGLGIEGESGADATPDGEFPVAARPDLRPDYRAELQDGPSVSIGEDAVRFDARPVVGRSVVPAMALEPATRVPAQSSEPAAASPDAAPFGLQLQRAFARAVHRSGGAAPGPVVWTVTEAVSLHPAARSGRQATGSPAAPPRAERALAPKDPSAPAATAPGARGEQRTNISLTLLADEVLVTVRGISLTADEEERLGEEMRGLLASFDLGERTVRVVTSRRT